MTLGEQTGADSDSDQVDDDDDDDDNSSVMVDMASPVEPPAAYIV